MNLIFTNRQDLGNWIADNHNVIENSEGNPAESLIAGWVNAMDTEEDRVKAGGVPMTNKEFLNCAYSEFRNMGYHRA